MCPRLRLKSGWLINQAYAHTDSHSLIVLVKVLKAPARSMDCSRALEMPKRPGMKVSGTEVSHPHSSAQYCFTSPALCLPGGRGAGGLGHVWQAGPGHSGEPGARWVRALPSHPSCHHPYAAHLSLKRSPWVATPPHPTAP